jgi:hypothetical protein
MDNEKLPSPESKPSKPYSRETDYHHARIGAGAALVFVVVLILLLDAISTEYETSPIVLASLLGTIAALMGVEVRAIGGRK